MMEPSKTRDNFAPVENQHKLVGCFSEARVCLLLCKRNDVDSFFTMTAPPHIYFMSGFFFSTISIMITQYAPNEEN